MSRNGHRGVDRARRLLQRGAGKKMPALTESQNAKMIRRLMVTQALVGSPKNFVIIVGNQLIDCSRTYKTMGSEGGKVIGDAVVLVHKRDLAKIIGDKAALKFWVPGVGLVKDGDDGGLVSVASDDSEPSNGNNSDA